MKKPTEPANAEMLLEEYGEVVEKTYTVLLTGLNQAKTHINTDDSYMRNF